MATEVDEDFRGLPLRALTDAGLQRARDRGSSYADVRVHRVRRSVVGMHDTTLALATDDTDLGVAVRVLVDGVWGFAAASSLSVAGVTAAADDAVEMARVAAPLALRRVELAPAEVETAREWTSEWVVDPFTVSRVEQLGRLEEWSARLLGQHGVTHVDASLVMLKEQKYLATSEGSDALQQRILTHPEITVVAVDQDRWRADAMRTLAPPSARGWEYLEGHGWEWDAELAALPELLRERMVAPTLDPGSYDLVLDPTNLWRTLHETVGHATEIDRALGHEVTLSGGTFATPQRLGEIAFGSELMHVTGDRVVPHGCATVGYDDDGVRAESWTIVESGVLVGFQVDRATAAAAGEERSNGCAQAASPRSLPAPRCANVSLEPVDEGPDTEDLISAVDHGLYLLGDAGFSIDRHCLGFRAGAQRAYEIVGGVVRGQVRDVGYQSSTPEFWSALSAVGGPGTSLFGGTSTCGKGSPREDAWVSHACPVALFSAIPVVAVGRGGSA